MVRRSSASCSTATGERSTCSSHSTPSTAPCTAPSPATTSRPTSPPTRTAPNGARVCAYPVCLYYPDSRVTARQNFFSVHVVQLRNELPEVVSVRAFISRREYCHSLYHNLPKSQITRLQQTQNSLARAVVNAPKSSHITPILRSLHWLKITERIQYKLLSLTHKVLTTTKPSFLHNLITVQPPRSTRSSSLVTLARPSTSSSLRITDRCSSMLPLVSGINSWLPSVNHELISPILHHPVL